MRAILLVVLFVFMAKFCYATNLECGEALVAASIIQNAIKKQDVQQFLDNIDEGVWFTDESVNNKKVVSLLKNKNSWLYKSLFDKNQSMRQYLLSNHVNIKINYKEGSALIYYTSPNVSIALTPSITLMCQNGRWVLTGIERFFGN